MVASEMIQMRLIELKVEEVPNYPVNGHVLI